MWIKEELANMLKKELELAFPDKHFSICDDYKEELSSDQILEIKNGLRSNIQVESVNIKSDGRRFLGLIIAWNGETETAYIVFRDEYYDCIRRFIPYTIEITSCQDNPTCVVKIRDEENDGTAEVSIPSKKAFNNKEGAVKYIMSRIIKWFE